MDVSEERTAYISEVEEKGEIATIFLLVSYLTFISALKMEPVLSSET
jgi:hypothetical protein